MMENYNNLNNEKPEVELFDLEDIYFEQSMKDNFGGFGSEEERNKVARKYNIIGEGTLEFYKVQDRVYHIKTSKVLEPVEYWFEKEEQSNQKDKDYYMRGQW